MSSIPLIPSSFAGFGLPTGPLGGGRREPRALGGRSPGDGTVFGSDVRRFGSLSRRPRKISPGRGRPNGPVFLSPPDVGTLPGSSLGNVGAVVPLGGRCITPIVG